MVQGGFLSGEQRAHLEALVRRPSERHGIARRANAMLLLDDGLSCEAVARVLYLDDVPGVAVVPRLAEGEKCARCWKILPDVGIHAHPGVCARCDQALG